MSLPVDCTQFSYIGKTIENSGLLETWFKNVNITSFDDFPSLNAFVENEALGIEFSINDDSTIETIFIFPHSPLPVPLAETFDISRTELNEKLGAPFFSYEKDPDGEYDFTRRSNDKWVNADKIRYISFTYNEDDQSINMIAIGNQSYFN